MKIFDPKLTGSIEILNEITGDVTMSANLLVEGNLSGNITGSASTASYIELSNVDGSASLASRIFFNSSSIASLETVSGSYANSASFASSISANSSSIKSLNAVSGSYANSASFASSISANSSSIKSLNAVSSSYLLNTTDTLTGDLTVTGNIIATTLNVQDVTASVIYSSGSNVFGSSSIDTQQFTGSIEVSGSIDLQAGDATFADNVSLIANSAVNLRVTDGTQNIYVGSSGNTRFGLGAGASIIQSTGESFGIGTQDGNSFILGTNNTAALTLDTSQNATFAGDVIGSASILNIKNDDIRFKTTGDETMLRAVTNGSVELMYNNSVKIATTDTGVTFSNLSNTSAASSTVDEIKIGTFGAGRPAIYFGTSNTTYTNSTWFIENIGAAGKLRFGRNGKDIMEIFNDGDITMSDDLAVSGNITAIRGFFNSGATNVVATFTSTDGTATLQCADSTGNVEFGASGNNFVVQPAGGVSQLTVGSSSSTFAGSINVSDTSKIEKAQLTTQFDTSSFLRLHPSATTNSGGYTNMIFGTDTANNYGVAIGGKRAGTDGTPTFSMRMLNDSITGTEVLNISNSGNAIFAGDAIFGHTSFEDNNSLSRKIEISAASPVGLILNDTRDTHPIAITNDGAVLNFRYNTTAILSLAANLNATFAGNVTVDNEVYLDNGKYLRFKRSSGGLSIQTLGIESGTDDVRLLTSGAFNLVNGGLTNLLSITNSGNATFAGEISSGNDININNGKLVVYHSSAEVRIKSTSDTGESYISFSDPSDINPGQIYYGHTTNRMAFRTNDDERMAITSGGDVGIGTSDNTATDINARLHVYKQATANTVQELLRLDCGENNHRVGVGGAIVFRDIDVYTDTAKIIAQRVANSSGSTLQFQLRGSEKFNISSSGTIKAPSLGGYTPTGADLRYDTSDGEIYYQTSSERYKTDIVNLESSLDKINLLRPVRYKDINTNEPACGLIAEEVAKTIPEVVFKKEIEGFDKPQIEGLNYADLVPFLIKSIQELKAEIEILKNK